MRDYTRLLPEWPGDLYPSAGRGDLSSIELIKWLENPEITTNKAVDRKPPRRYFAQDSPGCLSRAIESVAGLPQSLSVFGSDPIAPDAQPFTALINISVCARGKLAKYCQEPERFTDFPDCQEFCVRRSRQSSPSTRPSRSCVELIARRRF
jgi:hypothetical protein